MKHGYRGFKSVIILQLLLVHSSNTLPFFVPQTQAYNSMMQNVENDNSYKNKNPNNMLYIDLSQLQQRSSPVLKSGDKLPQNLLGIDISVLSKHPDKFLPIDITGSERINNPTSMQDGEFDPRYDRLPEIEDDILSYKPLDIPGSDEPISIPEEEFDLRYDRLPVIKNDFSTFLPTDISDPEKLSDSTLIQHEEYEISPVIKNDSLKTDSVLNMEENARHLKHLPINHIPLNIAASISKKFNKKQKIFKMSEEKEKNHAAKFLSHLLQLSPYSIRLFG